MVKLLIKAATSLTKMKYSIKIVPIAINYDRIFDATFLSEETLDGNFKPESTFLNVAQKIASMNQDKLGAIFVKYCNPIDLN
jgi:glycerol-3-phosphate O-acyltransferase